MKTLVVYDSFFGNTEKIAQAIGSALEQATNVSVIKVGNVNAEHLSGVDLLVVGSPTRAFSASPDTKAWLRSLAPKSLRNVKVASFDTRADVKEVDSRVLPFFVSLFGYAAEPIAKSLVKRGGTQAVEPAGFFITDTEGPLRDGELERAAEWARRMVSTI